MIFFLISMGLPAAGPVKVPFPAGIPGEHFSYFQYPTDVLGFKDCPEGAEITPEGYLYTGSTEIIFLHGPQLSYFPLRKHYWLEKNYLPIHHWVQDCGGTEYRFSAFAAPLQLDPEKNLVVFLNIKVINRTDKREKAYFALGSRYLPGESEGSGRYAPGRHRFRRPATPKEIGMYEQEGEEFSPDWQFEFMENYLLREGKILYAFSSAVPAEFFSYRGYETEAEKRFQQPVTASSPVGIALFSKELNPGESFEVEVKMPYTPVVVDLSEEREFAALDATAMKQEVTEFWEGVLSQGMQVELPEAKPVNVYKTSLIYDLIARDKIGEHYIQKVNEFQYDAFWLRDSAYIVRSYDLGGYHDIARECLDFFFLWQQEDGNFLSQGGQYDGWGQALFALTQHYRLTRDKAFAEKCLAPIMKAASWLDKEMKKDPLGIMPITTPGDNEAIERGHVTGHNFWALAGLKNAVIMAEALGKHRERARLQSLFNRLGENLMKVLAKVLKRNGGYIPPALDKPGGQDWGNLMGVYPEEILPAYHPAITETLKRAKGKYRENIMTYGDTQYLHLYLTMKNTETLIVRGDQDQALEEFYAILAHTSSTQAGFEFSIRPWADRDFHSNLAPHGWFAAKYRNLLRSMLVREREDVLHLLSVVSPAWAVPGEKIVVKDAPTYFGKISYKAVFTADGLEIEITPQFFQPPKTIALSIPYFAQFISATTGKIRHNTLLISPKTRKLTIKWQQNKDVPAYSFVQMVNWLKQQYMNQAENFK